MVSTIKISCIFLMIVFINLVQSKFSEVPPPPQRPERFHSREELKKYLQKLHEYHSIVGRWRLRRESDDEHLSLHTINNDHLIPNSEFIQRLRFKNENN